jgi:endoglucanase
MILKEYAEAFGPSGCEGDIRNVIKRRVEGLGDAQVDRLGNLIVHKAGKGTRVMLAAHMDEVGFIVTAIEDDGRIMFKPVGGIDSRILLSKRVVFGRSRLSGVIGAKPIHLLSDDERGKTVDPGKLFIDIGAESAEEAKRYIRLGDYAAFDSSYVDMGRFVKCKALDDRVGCYVVTSLLEDEYNLDVFGAFTVQEETGLRGAGTAAFRIEPQAALVFEGTTCADIASDSKDYVTTPGLGPAISIMDRTSSANGRLLELVTDTARRNGIPFQYRRGKFGGNDAGKIHRTKEGCATITISVPTRYIHSPVSMICREDLDGVIRLSRLVLKNLEEVKL